jgi:hypothetical protein
VPQDPNDEPASVLLERIKEGRATEGSKRANMRPAAHDCNDTKIVASED